MPIPSNFSNRFRKAVAILEYQGGKADAFMLDQQEYKYRARQRNRQIDGIQRSTKRSQAPRILVPSSS
jgi:hypothetical protein